MQNAPLSRVNLNFNAFSVYVALELRTRGIRKRTRTNGWLLLRSDHVYQKLLFFDNGKITHMWKWCCVFFNSTQMCRVHWCSSLHSVKLATKCIYPVQNYSWLDVGVHCQCTFCCAAKGHDSNASSLTYAEIFKTKFDSQMVKRSLFPKCEIPTAKSRNWSIW